jgi:hypothetical protein
VTFVTVAALAASALLVPALLPAMPASATTTATTTAAASATASASAAKSAEALDCAVTDATIRWGFKESFRSYLSGSIAHGEWTVSDGATYETPLFSWANGAGNFTGATNSGDVSFAGTVDFTGHGGILNTIIANPTLRFIDAPHASLFFDVSGTTQQGAEIDRPNVDFVSLDLSAVKPVIAGNAVTFTGVPTTLTAAGAVAFGTYEAGEAFDPITINFTAKPGCLPTPENLVLRWLPWVAAGLGLLAAAGATLVTFRRRGRPAPSE